MDTNDHVNSRLLRIVSYPTMRFAGKTPEENSGDAQGTVLWLALLE